MALTVLLALVVISVLALSVRQQRSALSDSYQSRKPLSEPEQTLYWRLREAMPDCVVLSQVAFSRFIEPKSAQRAMQRRLFSRISQKSVDFLVCLPDFTIVAAIELDDRTHRPDKDAQRDSIFASANVPLVRLNVGKMPPVDELRALFTK